MLLTANSAQKRMARRDLTIIASLHAERCGERWSERRQARSSFFEIDLSPS
jgi:hypothetical protein